MRQTTRVYLWSYFVPFTIILCAVFSSTAQSEPNKELERWEAKLNTQPNNLSIRLKTAKAAEAANQPDKIVALLTPHTDELPTMGLLLLAGAHSDKKQYDQEVSVLKMLVLKDESQYLSHYVLGQAYSKLAASIKNPDEIKKHQTKAIESLRQCIFYNKKYKPAYDALLEILLAIQSNHESRELVSDMIAKFGARANLLNDLCRLDSNDGFVAQAVTHCRQAIDKSPSFADNYVYLAQSLSDQKDEVTAARELTSAARRLPQSEFIQWAAGTYYMQRKNYPVAVKYFKQAVLSLPSASRSQLGLAQAHFHNQQIEQALPYYVKACQMDANTHSELLSAVSILRQQGEQKWRPQYERQALTCRSMPSGAAPK